MVEPDPSTVTVRLSSQRRFNLNELERPESKHSQAGVLVELLVMIHLNTFNQTDFSFRHCAEERTKRERAGP